MIFDVILSNAARVWCASFFQLNFFYKFFMRGRVMRKFFLIGLCCVGMISICVSQQTPWEWVNPLPQGNPLNGVWVISQDSVAAVGSYGTVVRTSNGGLTWQVEPTSGGITTQLFATQFISPTTGWAAGEGGLVLKTVDGGAGWSDYSAPTFLDLYAVYFISSSTGWVAGSSGQIFETTNGGTSWVAETSGTASALYSIYFVSPTTGWISGADGKILKTTDAGTTWTSQTSGTIQSLFSITFTSPTLGWAAGVSGTILNTVNGGTTWVPQTTGSLTSFFSIQFASSMVGWAAGAYGTIMKTTNGGINWFQQVSPTYNDLFSMQFISATQGWVVGDFGTILATTNGGSLWMSQSTGPKNELYAANFPTPTTGFVVGDEGAVLKSTNSGQSWTKLNVGLYLPMFGVKFVNASFGWVVGDSAVILRTTNGGNTWVEQNSHTDITLYSVDFVSTTTGWAVGDGGTILKTINSGTTWTPQTSPTGVSLLRVRFLSATLGWISGDGGVILRTTNGGTTWVQETSGSYQSLYSISFANASTGYASGDFGTIVATTDSGSTWSLQNTNVDASLYGLSFNTPTSGWAVGDDGTLIATIDGGATWSLQTSGTSNTLYEVQYVPGTSGGVVFAAGVGGTLICSGITPFPVRTWTGAFDSLWSNASNWSPVGIPQKLDSVYIPATAINPAIRDISQQINIGALKIAAGTKLSIGPELAQLVVKDNIEVNGTLFIDPAASTELVMGGGFIVNGAGKFIPNTSTVAFTSQGQLKGTFYNVVVNEGATVQTSGNVRIKNKLLNLSNFFLRSLDTLTIENSDPFAFEGTGFTGAGTIKRAIQPGSTQPYRFESAVTFLRFYPGGTLPDTVWMTAYPGVLPPGQSDSLFVRRSYSIFAKGGSNYKAFMGLRYDTSETQIPIDEIAMFQDSSYVLTNKGQTDFLDSDLVAIYLDSVGSLSANWYLGQIDYIPKHPYSFTDSLIIKDNGSGLDTLIFGAFPGATDGIDTALGESELGTKPPAGTFDVRWSIPSKRGSRVNILDVMRGSRTQNIYNCDLQPSGAGYPMTLQWNKNSLTVGSYFLRDSSTGGGQFNVNMKYQNSFVISNSGIKVVQIVHSIPYYYTFGRRWNMVSLPITTSTNGLKTSIFPTATSQAYKFSHGYLAADTLKNGPGYWLKFPDPQTVIMEGFVLHTDTISVIQGWNMIGSISYPVAVSNITQIPSGIMSSTVYRYSNGYVLADSIRPSVGYWVKVSQAGKLVLYSAGTAAPKQSAAELPLNELQQFNIFTVTDNDGNNQALYFGNSPASSSLQDEYEMPPVPPEGIFDARFSSNGLLSTWSEKPMPANIEVHSAKFPITIHWHIVQPGAMGLKFSDALTGQQLAASAGDDGNLRLVNPAMTSIHVDFAALGETPNEFSLKQNYPNPFNPSTTIEFALPTPSTVTVRVFNILGQEIATLADNRQYQTGVHLLTFDAMNFGSGVYFYQLSARGNDGKAFQVTRKMLLLK